MGWAAPGPDFDGFCQMFGDKPDASERSLFQLRARQFAGPTPTPHRNGRCAYAGGELLDRQFLFRHERLNNIG